MIVYHEVSPEAVSSIREKGLKRTSRGEKSDDAIAQTDQFLDAHRLPELVDASVSRDNNLYAYVVEDEKIVSITDGARMSLEDFIQQSQQALLSIEVDPQRCYVSDLDQYDAVQKALEEKNSSAERLARDYWQSLIRLNAYEQGAIKRPEIMVTYSLPSSAVRVLKEK
ncbi:MAG TPA: hypothetical protein VK983_00540 [Candidatus Limnocylindrales bacterium]|nr:hypothetical protein [Candidatus Limnocylindrales bacterium]